MMAVHGRGWNDADYIFIIHSLLYLIILKVKYLKGSSVCIKVEKGLFFIPYLVGYALVCTFLVSHLSVHIRSPFDTEILFLNNHCNEGIERLHKNICT